MFLKHTHIKHFKHSTQRSSQAKFSGQEAHTKNLNSHLLNFQSNDKSLHEFPHFYLFPRQSHGVPPDTTLQLYFEWFSVIIVSKNLTWPRKIAAKI